MSFFKSRIKIIQILLYYIYNRLIVTYFKKFALTFNNNFQMQFVIITVVIIIIELLIGFMLCQPI